MDSIKKKALKGQKFKKSVELLFLQNHDGIEIGNFDIKLRIIN